MDVIRIVCPYCNKHSKLSNPEKFSGQKASLKCGNPQCGKSFTYSFEELEEKSTFLTLKSTTKVKKQLRVMNTEGGLLKIINLSAGNYLLGRAKTLDSSCESILIDDPCVSRKHCFLKYIKNASGSISEFTITDLNSTNKTFLNGKAIQAEEEFYLQDGDEIGIGATTIKYRKVIN